MIPPEEIARLEATARARGDSDLGRALRRVLDERALMLDVVKACRDQTSWTPIIRALRAVEDFR